VQKAKVPAESDPKTAARLFGKNLKDVENGSIGPSEALSGKR